MSISRQSRVDAGASARAWTSDILPAVRSYLGGRRALWLLGGAALVAGAALNWGWLVAIGVAPLLVAVLPCVAMCALGLCMNKMAGRSCATDAKTARPDTPTLPEPPVTNRLVAAEAIAATPIASTRTLVDSAVRSESGERA